MAPGFPEALQFQFLLLTEDLADRAAAVQRDQRFMKAGIKRSLEKLGPNWVDRMDNLPLPRFKP